MKSCAVSSWVVAVGVPMLNPVPTSCSTLCITISFDQTFRRPRETQPAAKKDSPQHVSQIDPRVRVLRGRICAWDPSKASILLKEALQRAATRATVQPNRHFVNRLTYSGLKHEEQSSADVVVVNWD